MLIENTPIEEYQVNGHTIAVKRDDLYGQYPAPPLAKLRGASLLLARLKKEGVKKVGVYDTSVSKAGQGIAYLSKELGLECLLGFPLKKNTEPAESKLIAESLGAKLCPLVAGRTNICYYRFRKYIEEQNGYMLPLGLTCPETVEAIKDITAREATDFKTIVVCTGTGTIATGIALGTRAMVYGVSCGMSIKKQQLRILHLAYPYFEHSLFVNNLWLIPAEFDYYDALYTGNCPFSTSPYYDMKAWKWLVDNIEKLKEPILFYNIGV